MRKTSMALALGVVLLPSAAFATARYMSVTGGGVGSDADQSSAHQAADSMAQSNLQNACSGGTLNSTKKIFDQCSQLPDGTYVCNVNYTGICKIGS